MKIQRSNPLSMHSLCAWTLIVLVLVATTPSQTAWSLPAQKSSSVTPFKLNKVKARPKPSLAFIAPKFEFSANPSDIEVVQAHILPATLVPMSGKSLTGENSQLAKALVEYFSKHNAENLTPFSQFLKAYPKSRWRPALELNMGLLSFQTGYLSQALNYFRTSWVEARADKGGKQQMFASQSAAELILLESRLGRVDDLETDLTILKQSKFLGPASARVKEASVALDFMKRQPNRSFKCGPFAVSNCIDINAHKPAKMIQIVCLSG